MSKESPQPHPSEVIRMQDTKGPGMLDRALDVMVAVPFPLWFVAIIAGAAVCYQIPGCAPVTKSALERAEYKARMGRATEMTNAEADAFRKKQEEDSRKHRKAVLGN